jgi:hypothetical protein
MNVYVFLGRALVAIIHLSRRLELPQKLIVSTLALCMFLVPHLLAHGLTVIALAALCLLQLDQTPESLVRCLNTDMSLVLLRPRQIEYLNV